MFSPIALIEVALLDERLRQWNIKTILDTGRNVAGQHGAGAAGYAVPDYLTRRQFNVRLTIDF